MLWIAAVLAVAATGCIHGKLPALELYRLSVPDTAVLSTSVSSPGTAAASIPGAVAIAPYEAPGIYGGRQIVYRVGDNAYGTYPAREWAMPVGTMLGLMTQDILRAQPISAESAVFDPASSQSYPYVWRGSVRQLEEVDSESTVHAVVHLDASLVRASDDSVLWVGTARLSRPVANPTMTAIVSTLSGLAAEAIHRLTIEARAALAGRVR